MAADRVADRSVITTKAPTFVGAFFFAFENVHTTAAALCKPRSVL